jgi:Uma2 family endonuclease
MSESTHKDLDDADFYDVIFGKRVRILPMSAYAGAIADRLNTAVTRFLIQNDIGECAIGFRYRIPFPGDPNRKRRTRWSYMSYDRWPKDRPISYYSDALNAVPDIVAEVVSPGDCADKLIERVTEFLDGGVRLVWIIYPLTRQIHAYRPGTNQICVYFAIDELEALDILRGFQVQVAALFPPLKAAPTLSSEAATTTQYEPRP